MVGKWADRKVSKLENCAARLPTLHGYVLIHFTFHEYLKNGNGKLPVPFYKVYKQLYLAQI